MLCFPYNFSILQCINKLLINYSHWCSSCHSTWLVTHVHQVSSLSVANSTYLMWGTLAPVPPVPFSFKCWSTCQPFLCATRSVIVLLQSQFLHNLLHVKLSYRSHCNHETTDVGWRFHYAPASFPVVRTVQWVLANVHHSLTYLDANVLHDSLATHRERVGPLVQVSHHMLGDAGLEGKAFVTWQTHVTAFTTT